MKLPQVIKRWWILEMWNQLKRIAQNNLLAQLTNLRGAMALAAQEEYDGWELNEEGFDWEIGGGGICDRVSEAIADVVSQNIPDVEIVDGGSDGDDHAWKIVFNDTEAYHVDIPHNIYERGGGYSWTKVPGVSFSATDVEIYPADIDRESIREYMERGY